MEGYEHFDKEELEELKEEYYNPLRNEKFKGRLYDENTRQRYSGAYQRDYTRIMYSSSFRRLQGKMQLLGIRTDQFFRNRLTHSLEVAQIARSIAEEIGYNVDDLYVVEAGALAHDIGNAPFGHYGEKVLNSLAKGIGGFEGNAQTLRVLMEKEKKKSEYNGLNLTIRTLLGVTKYFKKYEGGLNNKFIYDDTHDILKKYIEENNIKIRTLDVQIVDIADEIAYAAHDLEDALKINCFTIDELLYEFELEKQKYPMAYKQLNKIVTEAREEAFKAHTYLSSVEYSQIFRKELTSKIVNVLINDVHLMSVENKQKTGTQFEKELGFKEYKHMAKGLKNITFKCINKTDNVYFYEQQGEKVIKGLFYIYYNQPNYLPVEYRPRGDIKYKKRLIIDYIAGMMDSFAMSKYKKYYGETSLKTLYDKNKN